MCVLQPCENPTQEGVWWRDDKEWRRYGAQHKALIKRGIQDQLHQVDLGTIVSPVHPTGARYVVKLQEMEQVALSSSQKRPVMVVDTPIIETVDQVEPPVETSVPWRRSFRALSLNLHYRDSTGNMQRYDPDIEEAILNTMTSGSQRTLLLPDGRSGHYFFDLQAMEQRSVLRVVSGQPILSNEAPVQIIAEVPWDACAMASIAAKADKSLRRKILVVVIEKFRCDENLDTLLAEKACPRRVVSKSTSTCSAASYEKFVDSVEEVLQRLPTDRMGDIIKSAGMEQDGSGPVKIAFKPVERSARSSADLDKPSDKALKSKAAFWISMAAPLAAAQASVYGCAVQLKIRAYLVIVSASAWSKAGQTVGDACSGYVVVDKPEHGLPLAEVTVC